MICCVCGKWGSPADEKRCLAKVEASLNRLLDQEGEPMCRFAGIVSGQAFFFDWEF